MRNLAGSQLDRAVVDGIETLAQMSGGLDKKGTWHIGAKVFLKWDALEIRQSTIYYAWLLGQWDKRIVDQESDVPSIIFFILFIDLGHSKLFIFIFVIL